MLRPTRISVFRVLEKPDSNQEQDVVASFWLYSRRVSPLPIFRLRAKLQPIKANIGSALSAPPHYPKVSERPDRLLRATTPKPLSFVGVAQACGPLFGSPTTTL